MTGLNQIFITIDVLFSPSWPAAFKTTLRIAFFHKLFFESMLSLYPMETDAKKIVEDFQKNGQKRKMTDMGRFICT